MLTKKRPHLAGDVDAAAGRSDEPSRERLSAEPLMTCSVDAVERYGRAGRAIGVFAADNARRERGFDRRRRAAISYSPFPGPGADVRKAHGLRCNRRDAAGVRREWIRSAVEDDRRHRTPVGAPGPGQRLRGAHHSDRCDAIGERARKDEGHAAAVRKTVRVDSFRVDVVRRLKFVDQLCDESDIVHQLGFPPHVPDLRAGTISARRIHNDEPFGVSKPVPTGHVHLLHRPSARAVHADDERRRFRAVVAGRNVELVLPSLPGRNDRAVVAIVHVEADRLAQRQGCRQRDCDQDRSEDGVAAGDHR